MSKLDFENNPDSKEAVNDRYNPELTSRQLSDREEAAFDDIARNYNQSADSRQEDQAIKRSKDAGTRPNRDLAEREQQGSGSWNYDPVTNRSTNPVSWGGRFKSLLGRNKLAGGGILGVFLAIAASLPFLGTAMAPFALVSSLRDDLNDQLAAMEVRSNHIFRNKMLGSQASREVVAGCTTLSIRCKFRTLSTSEVQRLQRAGIDVEVGSTKMAGRVVPLAFHFRDQTFTPEQWRTHLQTSHVARNAQIRANNMEFIGFSDKTFRGWVMGRHVLTKAPPALRGSQADRLNQLMTATRTPDLAGVRLVNATDADGNTIEDRWNLVGADGEPITDPNGNPYEYDEAGRKRVQNDIDKFRNSKIRTIKPGGQIALGALSVLGAYDLACTANNMVGTAAAMQRVKSKVDQIQFAYNYTSQVHKIMAGDGDEQGYETVSSFITEADGRREVLDPTATISSLDGRDIPDGDIDAVMMPNPNYGKSALDNPLAIMSMTAGGYTSPTPVNSTFSLGGGPKSLLGSIQGISSVMDTIINPGDSCAFVQNPITRGAGIIATVAIMIGSGGTVTGAQIASAGAMIVGIFTLSVILDNLISGSVMDTLTDGEEKVGRMSAIWGGEASKNADTFQARGAKPASAEEIVAYSQLRHDVSQTYLAAKQEVSSPLDIKDPSSVASVALNRLFAVTGYQPNVASLISTLPTFVASSFNQSVYARTVDVDRFKQCDDPELTGMGIDADVQCNIRFVMPEDDLKLNVDEVAQWMEDQNYVERDTTTGLPPGYTPPDPEQAQNAVLSFIEGATVGQFFGPRADKLRGPGNRDYALFLEYCAYRVMPFGKSFNENLIGEGGREWRTGEKCMEDSQMMSYFRIYTLDKSIEEGLSEEEVELNQPSQPSDDVSLVRGTDREIAQAILDNDNISFHEPWGAGDQIRAYASGNTDCYLSSDLLQLIASLGETYKLQITSLNRSCTGSEAGSGQTSLHWQGRAVDFGMVDGAAATGARPDDIAVYNSAMRILPHHKLELGQLTGRVSWDGNNFHTCRPANSLDIPANNTSIEFPDSCNHIHIAIPER